MTQDDIREQGELQLWMQMEGTGWATSQRGQSFHSWGQGWRFENRLSWAGILQWDGGMSHMLSMSCLCVYQSDGCVKMVWVIAIWAGLQIHCPRRCPPVLRDEFSLVGRQSPLLRQASPPATAPFPPTPTAVLFISWRPALWDQPGHYKALVDTETTASSHATQRRLRWRQTSSTVKSGAEKSLSSMEASLESCIRYHKDSQPRFRCPWPRWSVPGPGPLLSNSALTTKYLQTLVLSACISMLTAQNDNAKESNFCFLCHSSTETDSCFLCPRYFW